ncbi:hypothetical protein FB459_2084 [Yimella lutea]|uniref:Uncharacterized protein n=1 Tax=Yimella lutea TaxID=587872 RepID=A0A542EGZ1_9MICO|nr:hypothetical protein FB459_2084 [Yimella lutea]
MRRAVGECPVDSGGRCCERTGLLTRSRIVRRRPLRAGQLDSPSWQSSRSVLPSPPSRHGLICFTRPSRHIRRPNSCSREPSATLRTQPATFANHGIANRLVVNTKPLGDLLQGEPIRIESRCADTASVAEARSPQSATRPEHELRDRATVNSVLRSYRANGYPSLVIGDEFGMSLSGQSCLRLDRIFRDHTSCIVPFRGSIPRPMPLRPPENTANQRFQRRTLV